jgi:uncharacterized protein
MTDEAHRMTSSREKLPAAMSLESQPVPAVELKSCRLHQDSQDAIQIPTSSPETAWRKSHRAIGYACPHMVDDAVIQEAGRRLSQAAPDARIILFGSYARGEAGKHSDLDLLVIEPSVENPARESVRLRRALGDLVVAADVIVASEERVRQWRDVRGSVIHAALNEGRELAA